MTLRPSSVDAATGSTSTSTSGVHDRSLSVPSPSRTTTITSGPFVGGYPASRTAVPAVVPRGTRSGGAAECSGAGLVTAMCS